MNKYKVTFTAEKIYFADSLDKAQGIAERDVGRMANPLKAKVYSVSPHKIENNVDLDITDTYKAYTVFVSFHAKDEEDAEDFVYEMQPKDWLEHLEEEE